MVKVIFLKDYTSPEVSALKGVSVAVSNNVAHMLIEAGIARLFKSVMNRDTKEMISTETENKDTRKLKQRKSTYQTS